MYVSHLRLLHALHNSLKLRIISSPVHPLHPSRSSDGPPVERFVPVAADGAGPIRKKDIHPDKQTGKGSVENDKNPRGELEQEDYARGKLLDMCFILAAGKCRGRWSQSRDVSLAVANVVWDLDIRDILDQRPAMSLMPV